ncbi:MAG: spore coat protein CotH [Actinomycetales bacterium]|nr:spore coat protein CotH [Actinomycetales bacterium]
MHRPFLRTVAPVALVAAVLAPALPVASAGAAPAPAESTAADAVTAEQTGDITYSVPSGTFQGEVSVSLGTGIAGAQVRYTTDGRPPGSDSALYTGSPVRLTRTTQLRAQAFVDGAATGEPGTALYVARNVSTGHDLPVLLMDDYGKGKPGRDTYLDVAVMEFQPVGGSTSIAESPTMSSRAGFHLRGQSSAMFEKAPYRLELWDNTDDDRDLPLLGMPEDSDWVLRGPFSDKSLIRDAFVYGLGRDMGMQAPRFAFFELYLNLDAQPVGADDYQGVYMLVETIKNSKNRLDLKQLKASDTTLPKISGGYIFKFEWMAAEEPILSCSGANCWNYLEVHDPDDLNAEQRAWLTEYLLQFNTMLHGQQLADATNGYPAWIDVPSWVDQMIMHEFTRGMDAYIRSQYFYKDRDTKIFAGPLWDFDLTFGVGGYFNNNQISGWQYQQTRTPATNDWFTVLIRDPAFLNHVRARWQELRRGLLSDTQLQARMNTLSAPLTNAAARNFQRWPNLTTQRIGPGFITSTEPTWQGQLESMRTWMLQRAAWLDSTSGWGGSVTSTSTTTTTTTTTRPTTTTTTPPTTTTTTTTPPTTTTTRPTTTTTTTTTTRPTTTTTSSGGGGACSATYTVVNQWPGGFQGEVRVTAGSSAIPGWRLSWTFADGQTISQAWGGRVTASGSSVTATNESWNGSLGAGASTSLGFIGTWNGTNSVPAVTCTAG